MKPIKVNGFTVHDVAWFSTMSSKSFGIVFGATDMGERKAYIDFGDGFNEEADVRKIASHGAKVHPESLEAILNYLRSGPAPE